MREVRPNPWAPGWSPDADTSFAPARWSEHLITTDPADALDSPLRFRMGRIEIGPTSGPSAAASDRRVIWTPPGFDDAYNSYVRSVWWPGTVVSGQIPQFGHVHRLTKDADGSTRALVVWNLPVFQPNLFNAGVWYGNEAGTVSNFGGADFVGKAVVTDGSRTANVVTVTVPAGHQLAVGDWVVADVADATYDGTFQVTAVTATTIAWAQTAANDPSCGAGTVVPLGMTTTLAAAARTASVTDAVRAGGTVTATVAAGHSIVVGDVVVVDLTDATYDGLFTVLTAGATTITWRQAVADDPSSGAGTLTKYAPMIVETWAIEDTILTAVTPYRGDSTLLPATPTPSMADLLTSFAFRCNTFTGELAMPREPGQCGLLGAHLTTQAKTSYSDVVMAGID